MPLVGPDSLVAVDGQHVRLAFGGRDGRVCRRQRAEPGGEGDLARVVQVLAAEDQGLVLKESGVQLGEETVGDVADIEADDLCTDPSTCLADVEVGHEGSSRAWRVPLCDHDQTMM